MLKKLTLGLMAVLALSACSSDDPENGRNASIVGTWAWDDQNEIVSPGETLRPQTLAFFADGTAAIETVDTQEGKSSYDYYDYKVDNGKIRITSHHTGALFMNGTYVIRNGELTLNSYTYLRQTDPDTKGWAEQIVGSWNCEESLADRRVTTLLTFYATGNGSMTTFTAFNDMTTSTESEPFNYWVKRNYLIREFDGGYQISTLSFGILGNSLIIDGSRYTAQ